MNGKGQTMFIALIIAVMLFAVGMLIVNFLKTNVTEAQNSDNLDCSNSSISDGSKITCLLTDAFIPYFIVIVISVAGGIITARLTL